MNEIERAIKFLGYVKGYDIQSANLAIAALREQAARSKGCEVCNGSLPCDNGCDGFCDICDVPEVWKTIHKTGQYNYCPMCGRKLKEDNNEAD